MTSNRTRIGEAVRACLRMLVVALVIVAGSASEVYCMATSGSPTAVSAPAVTSQATQFQSDDAAGPADETPAGVPSTICGHCHHMAWGLGDTPTTLAMASAPYIHRPNDSTQPESLFRDLSKPPPRI